MIAEMQGNERKPEWKKLDYWILTVVPTVVTDTWQHKMRIIAQPLMAVAMGLFALGITICVAIAPMFGVKCEDCEIGASIGVAGFILMYPASILILLSAHPKSKAWPTSFVQKPNPISWLGYALACFTALMIPAMSWRALYIWQYHIQVPYLNTWQSMLFSVSLISYLLYVGWTEMTALALWITKRALKKTENAKEQQS